MFRAQPWSHYNYELMEPKEEGDQYYLLGSILVPSDKWRVKRITAWFRHDAGPAPEDGWKEVKTARLNLIAVDDRRTPPESADPRSGRVISIEFRRVDAGVLELHAADLDLELKPGAYWIGLTPIITVSRHGQFHSLFTEGPLDTGVEIALNAPGHAEIPKGWTTYHLALNRSAPCNRNLSLRLDGERVPVGVRGQAPASDRAIDRASSLHLRYAKFDPLTGTPEIPNDLKADDGCRLWIVQFHAPPNASIRKALQAHGAAIEHYVPDNACLVELAPGNRDGVASLPAVRWMGPWHPAFRIDRSIDGMDIDKRNLKPVNTGDDFPWKNCVVRTVQSSPQTKQGVAARIEELGGEVLANPDAGFRLLATMKDEQIRKLAHLDAVLSIERSGNWFAGQAHGSGGAPGAGTATIDSEQLRDLLGANYVEERGGYRGAGVWCAAVDSSPRETHVDLFGRISFVGPQRHQGDWHGTAVCGMLIGDGSANTRGRGMLPRGHVLFQDSGYNGLVDQYAAMQLILKQRGVLQTDSSGSYSVAWYDIFAAELDDLVVQYDLPYCRALGNTGNRMGSGWPKNVICVGGVQYGDTLQKDGHKPWKGSARGPAPDGRIKPDLVAFSDRIMIVGSAHDRDYDSTGGTSIATPMVAGCLGLTTEMWASGVFTPRPVGVGIAERRPRAATAKALLINSASQYPMRGADNGFHRFNQGWGFPDLKNLYDLRKQMFVVNADTLLEQSQTVSYSLPVRGDTPLRVTLVWSDPPAMSGTDKALVNDLDLDVVSPDRSRYWGNNGLSDNIWSEPGGNPDVLNNVEQVLVQNPQQGLWTVRVSAPRIAIDQSPGDLAFNQAFALVVTGVADELDH